MLQPRELSGHELYLQQLVVLGREQEQVYEA